MTSQHTADYPTLQEVLRLPVFAGCTVCGGAAGEYLGGENAAFDEERFERLMRGETD